MLAYCWNEHFFAQDCKSYIFWKLRSSLLADAGSDSQEHADIAVATFVHSIKTSRWKPGLILPAEIERCFPLGSAGMHIAYDEHAGPQL